MKRATFVCFCDAVSTVISIHALVKRATSQILFHFFHNFISIHALVKRATYAYKAIF